MMASLLAFYPHPKFPTISITGTKCAFNCKHCNHHYLASMIPCDGPDHLYELCKSFALRGVRGVLLSGGFNRGGYVPFEPFLDVIRRIKEQTGIVIGVHTGLPPLRLAKELGRAGVDLVDFDLMGSDETIREVLGSNRTVADYTEVLRTLSKHIPWVVPHICIGLHAGKIRGEYRAVEIAAEMGSKLVVFLVLNPTPGSPFQNLNPPPHEKILSVIRYAGDLLPSAELALGCMRPRNNGRVDLEIDGVRAGISRIALPSERTLRFARRAGLQVEKVGACCSLPRSMVGVIG